MDTHAHRIRPSLFVHAVCTCTMALHADYSDTIISIIISEKGVFEVWASHGSMAGHALYRTALRAGSSKRLGLHARSAQRRQQASMHACMRMRPCSTCDCGATAAVQCMPSIWAGREPTPCHASSRLLAPPTASAMQHACINRVLTACQAAVTLHCRECPAPAAAQWQAP